MKTTSEQLLARAEELEARARALRISAAEMNGHQTAEKQGKVAELFGAAVKLRKVTKGLVRYPGIVDDTPDVPELPPLPKKKRYKPSELAPYLERLLDGVVFRTTVELARLLEEHGAVGMNAHRLRSMLPKLPQIARVSGGQGTDIRWQLKAARKHAGGRTTGSKWTPAQRKKFIASMKRKRLEKAAAAATV